MYKNVLIVLVIALVLFEIVEHVVVPLAGFLLGRRRRITTGAEGMVGMVVEVRRWETTKGQVFVNGELWKATCEIPLAKGDKAVVSHVRGLKLEVEPLSTRAGSG
jgi:membrane protein implicated in regulation of membrane protease activity